MALGSKHADYDAAAAEWSRARDVLAGEDAVKAAGKKYLPKMDSQSDEEYAAYKARASFFGATAHTLNDYLDLVFRRAPTISTLNSQPSTLNSFLCDCDRWGLDFLRYARRRCLTIHTTTLPKASNAEVDGSGIIGRRLKDSRPIRGCGIPAGSCVGSPPSA